MQEKMSYSYSHIAKDDTHFASAPTHYLFKLGHKNCLTPIISLIQLFV